MRHPTIHAALLAAALGVALAACGDRSPTSARVRPADKRGGNLVTAFDCAVTVATREMRCTPQRPAGEPRANLILGGGYVQLSSRNAVAGAGTLTFEVAVTNLIAQKIGTTNGTSAATPGTQVFFASGPTVTAGTGAVTVVPDGIGIFTAANQPYYEYDEVIAPTAQSTYHTWTLDVDPGVQSFAFTVFTCTPVQYPLGWVTVSPSSIETFTGYMEMVSATAYNALGNAIPGDTTFTWSVSDPAVAAVYVPGLLTATGAGTATLTVSDGAGRSGTAQVVVQ